LVTIKKSNNIQIAGFFDSFLLENFDFIIYGIPGITSLKLEETRFLTLCGLFIDQSKTKRDFLV